MAEVAGTATTFNLPNYQGELYHVTPFDTPLLSMIGGVTGGETNDTKDDVWSLDDNEPAAQTAALEGADPTYTERDRGEVDNVKQIYQYGFSVTYTKQAATQNVAGDSLDVAVGNTVLDELGRQRLLKMRRMARDIEFTFLQGTFARPADNSAPRQTRGMANAIVTNSIAAGGAALSKALLDSLIRSMVDNGAPLDMPVLFANSFNRQQVSNIYGYAPESRTIGGVRIEVVETDFASLGVVYDRYLPTTSLMVLDVAHLTPTHLAIPGQGTVFVEPLAKTGAAWNFQLYGEVGLKYGPEQWHGQLTGLSDS